MRDVTSNHNFAFTLQYHTLESFIFDCQSVFAGHYMTMTYNNGTGICTLYNDDFITRNRERTQRNALKISQNDKHTLVYELVHLKRLEMKLLPNLLV